LLLQFGRILFADGPKDNYGLIHVWKLWTKTHILHKRWTRLHTTRNHDDWMWPRRLRHQSHDNCFLSFWKWL